MIAIANVATAAALLAGGATPSGAANWPQWRGPNLDGSSPERNLPADFGPARNVKWVAPLPGPGSSTPIVWADRVFVSSTEARTNGLVAMCLSVRDGRVAWQKPTGTNRTGERNFNMAAPSPVTDGKRVWFLYGTGELYCFDAGGRDVWKRNLVEDFGCFAIKFGYSSSPLLHEGRLYVPVIQREKPYPYSPVSSRRPAEPLESFLLAVDAQTGRDVWRHVRPTESRDESRESYGTATLVDAGGRREIVVSGGECVTGHDLADGSELWRWDYASKRRDWQRLVPSPVSDGRKIYATRARGKTLFALPTGLRGQAGEDAVAWRFDGPTPDVSTPLVYRGLVFVLCGDRKIVTCLDPATGAEKGVRELSGRAVFRASPTGADGRIYLMNEAGEVWVLSADERLEVLHRADFGEDGCQSTISVSGGRLFVRTPSKLYCIGR